MEHREVRCCTNDGAAGKIREELPFIRSIASNCQVRIPKETDEDGNDVPPDKETFLKQGSRKCPKPTEGDGITDQNFLEDRCTARKFRNVLSVLRKAAYNIIRLMQMESPKGRELIIDVIDEMADDFSVALKWIFEPIPSFY